jgi:glycogen operon protein
MMHAGTQPQQFRLPQLAQPIAWRLFINTAADSPYDIYPDLDGPPLQDGALVLLDRSLVCCVSAPLFRDTDHPAAAGQDETNGTV